jgi:hypothetical protein
MHQRVNYKEQEKENEFFFDTRHDAIKASYDYYSFKMPLQRLSNHRNA